MNETPISRRRALPLLAAGALAPWAPRLAAPLLAFDDREYPAKQIDDEVLRERLERFQDWKFGRTARRGGRTARHACAWCGDDRRDPRGVPCGAPLRARLGRALPRLTRRLTCH